jgi:DNA (cytosine-5)-methyltransferase 1
LHRLRTLHLFAGAGGGILADLLLGHKPVCAVEFDPYCQQVLAQRQSDGLLPWFPIFADVREFDGKPWRGLVDVVAGGFPCQDVSTAGARAGLKEGTRSGLFHEMMRAIDALRPGLVVIENVRGLLTAQGEPDPPDIEVIAATAARLDRAVTTIHRRRAREVQNVR